MNAQQATQALHEREYYLSLIWSKERMEERWKRIGYVKQTGQLKLFL